MQLFDIVCLGLLPSIVYVPSYQFLERSTLTFIFFGGGGETTRRIYDEYDIYVTLCNIDYYIFQIFPASIKENITRLVGLVGGLEHEFYFSHHMGMSSSQLTNSYFSRWLKPPTRRNLSFGYFFRIFFCCDTLRP